MQQRLSIITLGVSDISKSKKFYDALGWQAVDNENNDIIAYNLQQMTFVLYPIDKLSGDAEISMNKNGYSKFTLAYNVNSEQEVDTALIEAQNAGAKIVKSAQKVFWGGYSGYFADPDNFLWEVAFNPFSKLGPKGEFQWEC